MTSLFTLLRRQVWALLARPSLRPTLRLVRDDFAPNDFAQSRQGKQTTLVPAVALCIPLCIVLTGNLQAQCNPDTTPPVLSCGQATAIVDLNEFGTGTLSLADVQSTVGFSAFDACGTATITLSNNTFGCADVAASPITITVTATDDAGNSSSCNFDITVRDRVGPTLTVPADETVNCELPSPLPPASASDACMNTAPVVTESQQIVVNGNETILTRTFSATDNNGNTSVGTQVITVQDLVAPTITLDPANFPLAQTAECDEALFQTLPTFDLDDDCTAQGNIAFGSVTTSTQGNLESQPEFYQYEVTRLYTATDLAGNTATVKLSYQVDDTTPPAFDAAQIGANETISTSSASSCMATYTRDLSAFVSDNCAPNAELDLLFEILDSNGDVVFDEASFNINQAINAGVYTVRLTATDVRGNVGQYSYSLDVRDLQSPTISCPTSAQATRQVSVPNTGTLLFASMPQNMQLASGSDACGDVIITYSPASVDCGDVGSTVLVTATATDESGNTNSCGPFPVDVVDNSNPAIGCATGLSVSLDANGQASITASQVSTLQLANTDACGATWEVRKTGGSYGPSVQFDCSDPNPTTVILRITDANGNDTTCTTQVAILDQVAPTAVCSPITRQFSALGSYTITSTDIMTIMSGSSDNCSAVSATVSPSFLDCSVVDLDSLAANGRDTVDIVVTVSDDSGNTATCETYVLIQERVASSSTITSGQVSLQFVSGGLTQTTVAVPGLSTTSNPSVNFDLDFLGDFNSSFEFTDVLDPDGNLFATLNGIECQSTQTFVNVPAATYNAWVATYGSTLEFTVEGNSSVNDFCGGSFVEISTSVPVPGGTNSNPVGPFTNLPAFNCADRALAFDNSGNVTVVPEDVILGSVYLSSQDGDGQTEFSYTAPQASDIAFDFQVASSDDDFVFAYVIDAQDTTVLYDSQTATTTSGSEAFVLLAGQTLTIYVDDDLEAPVDGGGGMAYITNLRRALRTTNANGNFRPLTEAEILPFTGNGQAFYIDATTCGPLTYEISADGVNFDASTTLNCANSFGGQQQVTVRVTDLAGNRSECTSTITLLDEAPPSVVCVAQSASPGQNGTVTLDAFSFADPFRSNDFCGSIVEYQFVDAFNQPLDPQNPGQLTLTCADAGTIPLTIAAIDQAGNIGICNTTLTLSDTEPPTFVDFPQDIAIDCSAPGGTTPTATGMPTATDNCSGPVAVTTLDNIVQGQPGDPFCFRIERRFEAVDALGNVARRIQNIDVTDNEAPVFALVGEPGYFPADTTVECDSIPLPIVGVTDNCTPAASIMIQRTFNDSRYGLVNGMRTLLFDETDPQFYNYLITRNYIATDECGRASSKFQRVTVEDTQVPQYVGALDPMGVNTFDNDAGVCGATLTFDVSADFSDCADAQFLDFTYNTSVNGPGTGATFTQSFPVGLHLVQFTVEDPSGNDTTYNFQVEVQDIETPTVVARDDLSIVLSNLGSGVLDPATVDLNSYDNCGIASYALSQSQFGCADVGVNEIYFTVTDVNGRVGTDTIFVTVETANAPVLAMGTAADITIDCQDDINDYSLTGGPQLVSDCPIAATFDTTDVVVSGAGNCRDVERTFTATLGTNGQTATYVQLIMVRDTEAPEIAGIPATVSDSTRDLDFCMVTPMLTLSAQDNCGAALDTLLDFSNRGVDSSLCNFYDYTVIRDFIAIDDCGNTSRVVRLRDNVSDNEDPDDSAMPSEIIVAADANCQANISINLLDFIEDCAADDRFLTVTNNSASLGFGIGSGGATIQGLRPIGSDVISYTAEDPCGNDVSGTLTITVADSTAPQVACADVILPLDPSGVATLLPSMIDRNSSDLCTPQSQLSYSVTPNVFTATGQYGVTLTVSDDAGNAASCNATVFVIAPLTVSAGTAMGQQGATADLPVTVDNFTNVAQLSGIVTLDDNSIATFTGNTTVNALFTQGGSASPLSVVVVPTGDTLRYSLLAPAGTTFSLPNNAPLFTAEVNLLGAAGTSTPVFVGGDNRTLFEATQVFNSTALPSTPQVGSAGQVIITSGGNLAMITGQLLSWVQPPSNPIAGADVGYFNPSMTLNGSVATNSDGEYSFDVVVGQDITVRPSKNGAHNNGVDVLDVAILGQYIIGNPNIVLDQPYHRIAADADANGYISGNDLLQVQNVALAASPTFPNNVSWRFYPANASFVFTPGGIDVPSYDEEIALGTVVADVMNVDFTGTKIGDLNGSNNPAQLRGGASPQAARGGVPVRFIAQDREVEAGELVTVEVATDNFEDVFGYQFTLGLTDASLVSVEAGELPGMTAGNFHIADVNTLTALWDNEQLEALPAGLRAFTLSFTADRDARISELLSLTSTLISDVAYDFAQESRGVELIFEQSVNTTPAGQLEFALSQNRPNPFSDETVIDFSLPSAQRVTFSLVDATGRVLLERSIDGIAGWQSLTLRGQDLPASGVYHYRMVTETTFATRSLTLTR